MFDWEEYKPELFVEREQDISQLLGWANAPSVPKQVKSLVAPPGAGKTWILQAVRERLERRAHPTAPPERLVIFCDVPRLVNGSTSTASLNEKAILDWLEQVQQQAAMHFCSRVSRIERSGLVEIAGLVQRLVQELCEQCKLTYPVIVLVDGIDEVRPEQAAKIEWQILQFFIERQCVRLIIAHRDEYVLKNPLKNQAERFFLRDVPSVDKQFQKFQAKFYPTATHLTSANLDQFKRSLTHYQWNHPYINVFLFDKALKRSGTDVTRLITANDLRECLYAVIERRDKDGQLRHGKLEDATFDCLRRIAKEFQGDWTEIDLEKQLGLKFSNAHVDWLFRQGLVFTRPVTRHHQLADGLRELARDLIERGG